MAVLSNSPSAAAAVTENPSVSTTSLSDSPTADDSLGFKPYVHAVASFLLNPKTRPPLTMSVEGRWGSGKSSFLLQVAAHLREATTPPIIYKNLLVRAMAFLNDFVRSPTSDLNSTEVYTVWFNAWRSEKDEALWASFALSFIRQLSAKISPGRRVRANLSLMVRRFDFDKAKWDIFKIFCFFVAVIVFFTYGLLYPAQLQAAVGSVGTKAVQSFSVIALGLWAVSKAKHLIGNPLSHDLKKYLRNNAYEDKISFIDRFQTDFTHILSCYAGGSRVFVFIDDLDRCEVPRAAELMQAINLLLSADQPVLDQVGFDTNDRAKLFFLLGIDREIVAAGIAAKNVAVLPYLAGGRFSASTPGRSGLDFGYAYLEKFIQIPFRVPELEESVSKQWIARLTEAKEADSPATQPAPKPADAPTFSIGADPIEFTETVEKVSNVLRFNPRRVKQFVNIFRLQILILLETGKLLPPPAAAPATTLSAPDIAAPTLSQIGMIAGLLLRWPALVPELLSDPGFLQTLAQAQIHNDKTDETPERPEQYWRKNDLLMQAVGLGPDYVPSSAVVRVMLDLLPDTYGTRLKWAVGSGKRSGLLVGFQNDQPLSTSLPSPLLPPGSQPAPDDEQLTTTPPPSPPTPAPTENIAVPNTSTTGQTKRPAKVRPSRVQGVNYATEVPPRPEVIDESA